MATFREAFLPALAQIRAQVVDAGMGLRRFSMYIRRVTPSDGRGGIGSTLTVVDTAVTEKPRVRVATERDVVRGGGMIEVGDYLIDRITPRNDGNTVGNVYTALDSGPSAPGQRVFVVLAGPGFPPYVAGTPPSGGGLFTIKGRDATKNFEFRFVLAPVVGAERL